MISQHYINKVKLFFIEKKNQWIINHLDWSWDYKYLHIDDNKELIKYVEKIATDLAKFEGVEIFYLSREELNKKETNKSEWASGRFIFFKNKAIQFQYDMIKNKYNTDKEKADLYYKDKENIIPRIELNIEDKNNYFFTFLHELGHYFIYKRNEEQSEEKADLYIEEFFDTYLPPFFKWVFQISIKYRAKKELTFTRKESYQYWNDYQNFLKNLPS